MPIPILIFVLGIIFAFITIKTLFRSFFTFSIALIILIGGFYVINQSTHFMKETRSNQVCNESYLKNSLGHILLEKTRQYAITTSTNMKKIIVYCYNTLAEKGSSFSKRDYNNSKIKDHTIEDPNSINRLFFKMKTQKS